MAAKSPKKTPDKKPADADGDLSSKEKLLALLQLFVSFIIAFLLSLPITLVLEPNIFPWLVIIPVALLTCLIETLIARKFTGVMFDEVSYYRVPKNFTNFWRDTAKDMAIMLVFAMILAFIFYFLFWQH